MYTDVVVRLEAESLAEAKKAAIKSLDKLFAESYCEEKVEEFYNKISFEKENWWEEKSFEDWDVVYSSGDDYSDAAAHIDLVKKEAV
jgi:hypothetical protein